MNAPAGSKEHEGGTRLLVGALIAAGLVLALFIAFVVPSLIEGEEDEPGVIAEGEQSPGPTPAASPTPETSPSPAVSPTPEASPTTADGPSPAPAASPTAGARGTASPAPVPSRTSDKPSTPSSRESKPAPSPRRAAPAPAAPAPAAPAAPEPASEQMFAVAHAENGQSYAAVYVKRDGEWVALAEAIGNDAPKITP